MPIELNASLDTLGYEKIFVLYSISNMKAYLRLFFLYSVDISLPKMPVTYLKDDLCTKN